ncbi:vitamin K epoxide reductase family protein [Hymenobacter aerilatus]|uniref:Vitamin K epoxide reductase family protein n=1 Tax=Hymenobacter aerilatus TaxID=2932251 RepID=A0A8T9SXM9_9BACT|nr:vitamin K epoxide reductase family protein [Hymenobacter aerilatus]UOR06605.1 vitamin K epoxide reductase family protein [Hymenobacter aerilatus]
MNPTQLSHELRNGQSPDLKRRRWIIGLSLVTVAAGQIVTLYQTGIIKHLPDPPLDVFDSDKVDASDYGYKRLDTPDAAPMMITGALTATLAAAGGMERATTTPWLPVAMGVKTVVDVVTNLTLAREEWKENKALCFYCQASSVAALAALALAMPETVKAAKNLFGSKKTA